MRYTPAGVAVVDFRLSHASEVVEAGLVRSVEFEMKAIAIGEVGRWMMAAPLVTSLTFTGFLAQRSARSKTLVFHVTGVELPDMGLKY